jgi:hypothetical protein
MGYQDKIDLTKTSEPAWLKEVALNSCLNLKDLADIFKINLNTLRQKVMRGEFPPPDLKDFRGNSMFGADTTICHSHQWKVLTVRKFFKQAKENHNEKESSSNYT